ncbi:prolyl oligopeptidase family protein [Ferruginibacter sp.]|uniref:prolyl oligopeptidase family serine peptidase n=1 Tax=Ferruginibacter sp. TaxID=1940288 RepID=UPI0026584337|nr:hypothetical protein [Ferruginibacter sp.]
MQMIKKNILFMLAGSLVMMKTLKAQIQYPETKKVNQTDDYFGIKVSDPYRWLEDDKSDSTKQWVKAQNAVTQQYLDAIPYRKNFREAIEKVYNYPKFSAPFKKGGWFYFYKNEGLQNQSVLYRQQGLNGKPELVIDPNKLSLDGTTRLQLFSLSKDGHYAAIGLSKGGSDWQTYYVRDMKTGKDLSDELSWVKFSSAAWKGNGFYYSRYPAPQKGSSDLTAKNENHQVYFHKAGTPQIEDKLVYENKENPQRFITASTSEDEHYLFLNISDRGKGLDGNALYFKNLNQTSDTSFIPIVKEITNNDYHLIDNTKDRFILKTNEGAPNSKVIAVSIAHPDILGAEIIVSEKKEPLLSANTGGGKLFLDYLKDVSTRTYVYNFTGKLLNEIKYPGLGNSGGLDGNKDDKFLFYVYTSFTVPPTIYKYDIATTASTIFRQPEVNFNPVDYETKQVFYPSKDGTKIPMFIVSKKGIQLDGNNVTLLYGYGGFNLNLEPGFIRGPR